MKLKGEKYQIWTLIILAIVVIVNILVRLTVVRFDLTDDKRYTLSEATKQLLRSVDFPLEMTIWLDGDLNSGFIRLQEATLQTVAEMSRYADIEFSIPNKTDDPANFSLAPIVVHERSKAGKTEQTTVYPYLTIRQKDRIIHVSLLRNTRGLSGEENLQQSIENMEYAIAEAIHSLATEQVPRIAFIEGHGELPERNVYDITVALSRYFQVDRGVLDTDPSVLDPYKAIIIADPQMPFSDADKFIIDQYIMRGGRVLWLLNGVRFSSEMLSNSGMTPVIPLDLNLADMLFVYGVRINPALVQDVQCLSVPVDVSSDPSQPNYQPIPWLYSPLLLTSQLSPITRNLGQVSSIFPSYVDAVGGDDGIDKAILLASSTTTRLIPTPAQVDLEDFQPDPASFAYQYVPVAISMEGQFRSFFKHRGVPENIQTESTVRTISERNRQVVVASGSIIRNEWQQQHPLPVGYDRYSGMQFANRDFIVNSLLWLTDDDGLISLREKTLTLRLLNTQRAADEQMLIEVVSVIVPILLLAMTGGIVAIVRRRKYTKK